MPLDPNKQQQISGGLFQPVPGAFNPVPPPPAGVKISSSSVGSSAGGAGRFGYVPDISSLTPQQRQMVTDTLGKYTYSLPSGGYITNEQAQNANSYYNKWGGSDPAANQAIKNVYALLGSLPTTYGGNVLANQQNIQNMFDPNYDPAKIQHFRSYNEVLGSPWEGPWQIKPSKFTSTPVSGPGGGW